jgi:transcription initiation factor TFIIIB Brf1 subunit/transcription initiation factor TFIIB
MSNLDYTDKLAEILAKAKKNHISYGKDPSALTAAILSAACLKEG